MTVLRAMLRSVLVFGPLRRWREAFRARYETKIRPWHYRKATKPGVTSVNRHPQLVVSLTSYPERISTAHHTLNSLLRQSLRPDKLVLWLGEERFPNKEADLPAEVLCLREFGLTIGWCRDLRVYTKLLPALNRFPDALIVTADDDTYYPRKWLEALCYAHRSEPQHIYCHRAHRIRLDADGNVLPYRSWDWCVAPKEASCLNFLTGEGGVLYFPGCFHEDVANKELYSQLTPNNDDIWYWSMAVLHGTKVKVVQKNRQQMLTFDSTQHVSLYSSNRRADGNDAQMANVLAHYPKLKDILLAASRVF